MLQTKQDLAEQIIEEKEDFKQKILEKGRSYHLTYNRARVSSHQKSMRTKFNKL